jgi:hypothetical protein
MLFNLRFVILSVALSAAGSALAQTKEAQPFGLGLPLQPAATAIHADDNCYDTFTLGERV